MDSSGELRQNILTGSWVAVAPLRGQRPKEPRRSRSEDDGSGADCPFCPGNEDRLAGVVAETPGSDGRWATRVVPNRYPAFTNDPARGEWVETPLDESAPRPGKSLELGADVPLRIPDPLPAVGYQEVIVESPDHDRDLADLGPAELATVLGTYHGRYVAISASAPRCRIFLFRNRGAAAGTSLSHPHAQLIATAFVPPRVRIREIRALGYHGNHGRCLVCALPDIEPEWESRLVAENERFTAVVPWAAEASCEIRIVPREHQAEFGLASEADLASLAGILREVLGALRERVGDPSYNLVVHSPRRSRSGSSAFHWYLQIRPRSSRLAGFELATDVTVVDSSPLEDAARLRGEG